MSRDRVLLLTHTRDAYTVDRVADGIRARGCVPVRVDTDRFPTESSLTFEGGADGFDVTLDLDGTVVRGRDVRAVWHRRVWSSTLPDDLDPAFRDGCLRESRAVVKGVFEALAHARHLDAPGVVMAAEDKLLQLRAAQAQGLAVPRTLITNDPARVRAFRASIDGEMVAKMLTPLSVAMEGRGFFVHTSIVDDGDLDELDGLRLCPMVFQARVAKRIELRAIYVAGSFYVGAIDARESARAQVDWRLATPDEAAWQRAALPDDVADRLRAMMRALGLAYGAIDLIVTPDGEHVFLEVNPAGEWGMIEKDLGLPIGDALAAALVA